MTLQEFFNRAKNRTIELHYEESVTGNAVIKKVSYCPICEAVHPVEEMVSIIDRRGTEVRLGVSCRNAYFFQCADCGTWELNRSGRYVTINGERKTVCVNCRTSGRYEECYICGEVHPVGEMQTIESPTGRRARVCPTCYPNTNVCEECGRIIGESDTYEQGESILCYECYENAKKVIKNYSYKPTAIFTVDDTETAHDKLLYMGVELEVDDGEDRYECAKRINKLGNGLLYCKSDGSLDDGIEIVSHPCTLKAHQTKIDWLKVMEECRSYDFYSHDTTTCGLHVHASRKALGGSTREQSCNIAKIIMMTDKFYSDELMNFSRRSEDKAEQWAKASDRYFTSGDTLTEIDQKLELHARDRYKCVNLDNEHTIEFRVFRGTLNHLTFIATLQFVQTIVDYAKLHSMQECETVTFAELVQSGGYAELEQYCKVRNLLQRDTIVGLPSISE